MALSYFDVVGKLQAVISDSGDAGGDPDVQNISSTVTFYPSVEQVHSAADGVVYRLQPVKGRTNPGDGQLKTVDGSTVSLPANTSALGLPELRYRVVFTNVVYDKQPEPVIESFEFVAPTDPDTTVDLATVERLPV